MAVVVWAMLPLLSIILDNSSRTVAIMTATISLILSGVWLWLGKLEKQFYEGREVAPRNLPDKKRK